MPKTIHLIRHAQSTFNAAQEATGLDPLHFDARLSALGLSQVEKTRQAVRDIPCDVVISSPLTRALQTAVGLFEGRAQIRVEPLHREYQESSCDMGRSPRLLSTEFPGLAFGHLDDPWWLHRDAGPNGVVVEPIPEFRARVARFGEWLKARPETSVVVIGHGTFFRQLTGRMFANCEVVAWQPG
jgi:glucosyl-3-phosphoglycerate phosphatase